MAIITYGKSTGQKTSKGRRRVRRIEEAKLKALKEGREFSIPARMPTKAEMIGKRDACPRHLLAVITDLSFRPYVGDISSTNNDAMNKVVNHAHQRNSRKKWS